MLSFAQPAFHPVAVTGFNQDVVAEANVGLGAKDATTVPVDGGNSLYTVGFAKEFEIGGLLVGGVYTPYPTKGAAPGGLPDNGVISNGRYNFQLADYGGNNSLYLSDLTGTVVGSVSSGTLAFVTPTTDIWYSVALVATEGYSYLKATFNFTDGTSATTAQQQMIDWFNTTTMATLIGGMGRMPWTTPSPLNDNASSSNLNPQSTSSTQTKMVAWNIMVPCANQGKTVKSITFTYVSGQAGNNHRCNVMAIASYGTPGTPLVNASSVPARCGLVNGLVEISYTSGGFSPVTFSWDSLKVTGATAAGLPAGIYQCTVSDSNKCTTTVPDTVVAVVAPNINVTSSASSVCEGTPLTFTVTADVNEPIIYTWNPGGQTGSTLTITPASSGQYTVTAQDFWGCSSTATATAVVVPDATATFTAPTTVCSNSAATITYTGDANSTATFDWNGFAGAAVASGSGAGPYTIDFDQPGTYNLVLAVTENGCTRKDTVAVTVDGTGGSPVVVAQAVTTNSVTFSWAAVAGASGYQVSINGGPYVDPSSGPTGTTQVIAGLAPNTPVSISVIALGGSSCAASVAGAATAKTFDDAVFIPSAFTPNGDGKNDVFRIYSNQVSAVDFKIFNQWGQLIWSTTNVSDGWDGSVSGKPQPSGVYIYAVKVTLLDGSQSSRKGSISLVR